MFNNNGIQMLTSKCTTLWQQQMALTLYYTEKTSLALHWEEQTSIGLHDKPLAVLDPSVFFRRIRSVKSNDEIILKLSKLVNHTT